MADEQMFTEAVGAIRQGQNARARDLLTRLLRTNQNHAQYWIYLSTVVTTDKERKYCLENALKAEPHNVAALRGMVMLGLTPVDPNQTSIQPVLERKWDVSEILSVTGEARETQQAKIEIPWSSLGGFFLLGAVVFSFMLIGFFGNPLYEDPGPIYITGPKSTQVPFGANDPAAQANDPDSTAEADGGSSSTTPGVATATFTGPTPLSSVLNTRYTPTPLYVVTPHENNTDFTFGMQNFESGQWQQAITYFENFIKLEPGNADVRYYLGLCYYEIEEFLKAKNAFNGAINLDETLGAAYLARAQSSIALRQTGLITADLNDAIKYSPDWVEVYLARADYRLSGLHNPEGILNPEGALADAESALELDPENARAYFYIAEVHQINQDYEDALTFAELAHEYDLTLVDNYFVLSRALIQIGQAGDALGYIQTYLTYNPESGKAWLMLAQAQAALEEYENVLVTAEIVKEVDDTVYEINYYRGFAELALDDYENAIDSLENAIRIFDKWFEPQLALGQAIFLNGDAGNGYAAIHKAERLSESDEQLVQLYYWRALSLEALDNFEQANKDWVRLLNLPLDLVPDEWEKLANSHINGVYEATPIPEGAEDTADPSPTP